MMTDSLAMNTAPKGLIFNIQKFSVHDGPGIRTTVFLKGCPLACLWCSNPESQSFSPELMTRDMNCRRCGACAAVCPQQAIALTKITGRRIDRKKCRLCLTCAGACLYDALMPCGKYLNTGEVLDEVMQDRIFYKNSGGGVTISGGEPLSQPAFTRNLLEACQKEGLHTAIETSGAGAWNDLQDILRVTDLLLFDIKHLDVQRHEEATGVSNVRILSHLRKAAVLKPVWLRIPLISRFNDSTSHILQVAALGREIGAQKISLLPYHEGGKTKCQQLGKRYGYPQGKAPAEKRIEKLKHLIEQAGLAAAVGH